MKRTSLAKAFLRAHEASVSPFATNIVIAVLAVRVEALDKERRASQIPSIFE